MTPGARYGMRALLAGHGEQSTTVLVRLVGVLDPGGFEERPRRLTDGVGTGVLAAVLLPALPDLLALDAPRPLAAYARRVQSSLQRKPVLDGRVHGLVELRRRGLHDPAVSVLVRDEVQRGGRCSLDEVELLPHPG